MWRCVGAGGAGAQAGGRHTCGLIRSEVAGWGGGVGGAAHGVEVDCEAVDQEHDVEQQLEPEPRVVGRHVHLEGDGDGHREHVIQDQDEHPKVPCEAEVGLWHDDAARWRRQLIVVLVLVLDAVAADPIRALRLLFGPPRLPVPHGHQRASEFGAHELVSHSAVGARDFCNVSQALRLIVGLDVGAARDAAAAGVVPLVPGAGAAAVHGMAVVGGFVHASRRSTTAEAAARLKGHDEAVHPPRQAHREPAQDRPDEKGPLKTPPTYINSW